MKNQMKFRMEYDIQPKQSREFGIYREEPIPYRYQEPYKTIELCEVIDIGYDHCMVPLQVYLTEDPLLYKLVAVVDSIKFPKGELCVPVVLVKEDNIRTYKMTVDGKVFMPQFEHIDSTDLDWELNKKVVYRLVDITPKENYVRNRRKSKKEDSRDRTNLSYEERLKLYMEDANITYIKYQFGFQEKDIMILPNKEGDEEGTLRFQVLALKYCVVRGVLSIDSE